MGAASGPDKNTNLCLEIVFECDHETGMWGVKVFANWKVPGGECCAKVGGSGADEYEYATRGEAAATIRGLVDRWLAENA